MAKYNIITSFIRFDRPHETQLLIFENKNGFRGSLRNSHGKVIESHLFSKNVNIDYIKTYFGFNDNNSY